MERSHIETGKRDELGRAGGVARPDRAGGAASAAWVAVGLSMLLALLASLLFVRSFGVDVFYADEWDFVGLLKESARGTLGAADLLAPHNGHVYLAPWGVMLLLGGLTAYNTVPLMYLTVACLLATSATVFAGYAASVGRSPPALALFVPIPPLMFSLRQHENMLWGNQISFAFAQTFSVLALWLLTTPGGRLGRLAFPGAALCAVLASCSAAPGLLSWPAGLLVLLLRKDGGDTPTKALPLAWALLGAAVWAEYLSRYDAPHGWPATPSVLAHPAAGTDYLLTLSGASLFWSEGAALATGMLLVLASAASLALVLVLRRAGENAFWIALGAFSLASLGLIAAGRSGLEETIFAQEATFSRYAAFSIPGVVALHGLLANLALNARSRIASALLCLLLAAMLAGIARSCQLGQDAGRAVEDSRRQAARILLNHQTEPPAAFTIFGHNPRKVQAYARFLDRNDLGTFAESAPNSGGKTETRKDP